MYIYIYICIYIYIYIYIYLKAPYLQQVSEAESIKELNMCEENFQWGEERRRYQSKYLYGFQSSETYGLTGVQRYKRRIKKKKSRIDSAEPSIRSIKLSGSKIICVKCNDILGLFWMFHFFSGTFKKEEL
jgi:hypothetical protein